MIKGCGGREGCKEWGNLAKYHVNAFGDDGKGPASDLLGDIVGSHLFVEHGQTAIAPLGKAVLGEGSICWGWGGTRPCGGRLKRG